MISDDKLVERAEAVVRDCGPLGEARTQASRAMEAAAGGPRVFKNWLAYQQGRKDDRFWKSPCGRDTLGQRLAKEIEKLVKDCSSDELQRAMLRFVGFFRRALVGWEYLPKDGGGS